MAVVVEDDAGEWQMLGEGSLRTTLGRSRTSREAAAFASSTGDKLLHCSG